MTKKKSALPSATIVGANINEFVAWDGEQYVLRPTRDSVLVDGRLKLIGSVRELSRVRRFGPGYVFCENPSHEEPCAECAESKTSPDHDGIQSHSAHLGQLIDRLYNECQHLKGFARGRHKTENALRVAHPDFLLWKELDDSEVLNPRKRREFFGQSMDTYGQKCFMDFIGAIVGLRGQSAYNRWKEYRDQAGLKRKRRSKSKS